MNKLENIEGHIESELEPNSKWRETVPYREMFKQMFDLLSGTPEWDAYHI